MNDDRTIADLRERVTKLTGPDRETDRAVWDALVSQRADLYEDGLPCVVGRDGNRLPYWSQTADPLNRYTASIDAVLSLIGKVKPGAGYQLFHLPHRALTSAGRRSPGARRPTRLRPLWPSSMPF